MYQHEGPSWASVINQGSLIMSHCHVLFSCHSLFHSPANCNLSPLLSAASYSSTPSRSVTNCWFVMKFWQCVFNRCSDNLHMFMRKGWKRLSTQDTQDNHERNCKKEIVPHQLKVEFGQEATIAHFGIPFVYCNDFSTDITVSATKFTFETRHCLNKLLILVFDITLWWCMQS